MLRDHRDTFDPDGFDPTTPRGAVLNRELRDSGDRLGHEFLMERLVQLRPRDAVLSEEGADDRARLTARRVWIVGPLDGTWEYGLNRDDWAVHVALWEDGRLVDGAVSLPCSNLTYSTSTTLGHPAQLSPEVPTERPLRVSVSRTRPPASMEWIATELARSTGRPVEVVPSGSAGAKAGEVLAGRSDVYLHDSGLSEWDAAAPLVVAAAAGAIVWRFNGQELQFNQWPPLVDGIVIAAPGVAAQVREVVNRLPGVGRGDEPSV